MNAVLHQLKWDFRRIRVAWITWIILSAATVGVVSLGLNSWDPYQHWDERSLLLQVAVIYLGGAALTCWITQTTPFSGSAVHWRTRPLSQASLFREKSLLILLLVVVPAVVALALPLWRFVPDAEFLLHTGSASIAILLALLALAAIWGSLAPRLASLLAYPAATLVIFYLSAFFSQELLGPVIKISLPPIPGPVRTTLLIGGLALFLLIPWYLQARLRRRRAAMTCAITGLVLAAVIPQVTRPTTPHTIALDPTILELHVRDRGDALPAGHTPLFPQLSAALPADQVLFFQQLSSTLTNPADSTVLREPQFFASHRAENHMVPQFTRYFPPGAKIVVTSSNRRMRLNGLQSLGRWDGGLHFQGSFSGYLLETRRLATQPLVVGASAQLGTAGRGKVLSIEKEGDGYNLEYALKLSTQQQISHANGYLDSDRPLLILAHHPENNIILVPDQNSFGSSRGAMLRSHSLGFHFSAPQLRRVFGSTPEADALAGINLHVFSLKPVASCSGRFEETGWQPFEDHPLPGKPELAVPDWTESTLPDSPTPAQVEDYLDSILYGLPDYWGSQRAQIKERFSALAPDHLNQLIARFPIPQPAIHPALDCLREEATEEHLPVLLDAVARDPRLATVLRRKDWELQAAPVLRELLEIHAPLPRTSGGDSVIIVASLRDPETYPHLAWHFLHASRGHFEMAKALAECPGFPLSEVIVEAWARGLSHGETYSDLSVLAATFGEKDALRALLTAQARNPLAKRHLAALTASLDAPGDRNPLAWAHEHFQDLRFEEKSRMWRRAGP